MKIKQREVIFYKDDQGREPAKEWLEKLRDLRGKARIFTRIHRAADGNFGDYKTIGDGVLELRIDTGPGYRIYFGLTDEDEVLLLLVGGDKTSQAKDISKAKRYWLAHKGK